MFFFKILSRALIHQSQVRWRTPFFNESNFMFELTIIYIFKG